MTIGRISVLALLFGTQVVFAAGSSPKFDLGPTCRAANTAGVSNARSEQACQRDEESAHQKLEQNWGQYSSAQQGECVRLSSLGGSPSYVELLTCLDIAKQAAEHPAPQGVDTGAPGEKSPRAK